MCNSVCKLAYVRNLVLIILTTYLSSAPVALQPSSTLPMASFDPSLS